MKIAIGVDSERSVHKGHFGDSPLFAVYEISAGRLQEIEKRANPFTGHEDKQVHHGKAKGIAAFLSDCDIFLGSGFGMHSLEKLQQKVKAVWLTRLHSLPEVLQALKQKDAAPFLQFDFSAKKFIPLNNFSLIDER